MARGSGAPGPELRGHRVLLRRWRAEDADAFAAINADPRVMEYFPDPLTPAQSAALTARIETSFEQRGYGLWALELPGSAPFAGFVGLEVLAPVFSFAPGVEIGWRLAPEQWGRGLATEAARLVVAFAFEQLALEELVALTFVGNTRSRAVMERIGMARDPTEDFIHPSLPAGHRLSQHVLYRIARGS